MMELQINKLDVVFGDDQLRHPSIFLVGVPTAPVKLSQSDDQARSHLVLETVALALMVTDNLNACVAHLWMFLLVNPCQADKHEVGLRIVGGCIRHEYTWEPISFLAQPKMQSFRWPPININLRGCQKTYLKP